jgi:23S rRNA (pseudouridine1915-N3)-methyltransferase|tara:strand:- start:3777 stop:4241 length:465 start_codon:yes stop_codon:yes gene_type:complete
MLIRVISVGNKPNQWESKGIEFYIKQLPKNLSIDFINLKSQQNPNLTLNEVLDRESSLILSKISKNDFVISWDLDGNNIGSKDFSNFILDCQKLRKKIIFIVGGSFGLSPNVIKRSDKVFSASKLTFPHRIFRLLLVEQIYRAHTIINNMPYHK